MLERNQLLFGPIVRLERLPGGLPCCLGQLKADEVGDFRGFGFPGGGQAGKGQEIRPGCAITLRSQLKDRSRRQRLG